MGEKSLNDLEKVSERGKEPGAKRHQGTTAEVGRGAITACRKKTAQGGRDISYTFISRRVLVTENDAHIRQKGKKVGLFPSRGGNLRRKSFIVTIESKEVK